MLNSIKTDLTEQNTLFVGCRLNQEIDLLYALAEYHGAFPAGRRSIFVTDALPNRFEEAKLSAHGIDSILLIDNYDVFYTTLIKWGKQAEKRAASPISLFAIPQKLRRLGNDMKANLSFLLRDPAGVQDGQFSTMPDFYIRRDVEDSILRAADAVPLSLIRGRRFCGKTLLLRSLASSAKARNVYLFESNPRISEEVLNELSSVKNGLFLFDTNVLSPDTALSLAKLLRTFSLYESTAIVAVNRTEPDIVGTLVRYVSDETDFDLESRLSKRECHQLNQRLDSLGILKFNCRKTLLDNTFALLEQYPNTKSISSKERDFTENEVEVLLVTAVVDKAYSSVATALEVRTAELFTLCEKLAPIIELVETSSSELRDTNSRHKIVANSKVGLALQTRNVVIAKGHQWVSDRIKTVVGKLVELPKFASIAHSMYMFDAINYVLSQTSRTGEGTGYVPVVRSLYENLQPILNSSADYWLQRAKAVLNLENDQQKLLDGIAYALKSYHEADRRRTIDNAEFSVALLYGKLCFVTQFKEAAYVKEAVEWFSRAIRNYHRNPQYVKTMLEGHRYRTSWFHHLCGFLEKEITDINLLPVRSDVRFLLDVRREWKWFD